LDIRGSEPQANAPVVAGRLPIGLRILYMFVFAVTFWIVTWVLAVTVITQLILTLLGGQRQPELLQFSAGLSRYISQVTEFLTFLTERPPFPFAPWPTPSPLP
jgi:hypothetical protein